MGTHRRSLDLGGLGEDDATGGLFGLGDLDEDAVTDGSDLHGEVGRG